MTLLLTDLKIFTVIGLFSNYDILFDYLEKEMLFQNGLCDFGKIGQYSITNCVVDKPIAESKIITFKTYRSYSGTMSYSVRNENDIEVWGTRNDLLYKCVE